LTARATGFGYVVRKSTAGYREMCDSATYKTTAIAFGKTTTYGV
jgi:hypothetical protein